MLRSGVFNQDSLEPLVRNVMDPVRSGRRHGPLSMNPQEMTLTLIHTLCGLQMIPTVDDAVFIEARFRYRSSVLSYLRDWSGLAANAEFGSWFEEPSMELFINRACDHLVQHIGLIEIAKVRGTQLPPLELDRWDHPPLHLLETVVPKQH
jgi:hypothetical protein